MPRISFTQNIQRHVACPPCDATGATVREALDQIFKENERARGYVLDERGAVRPHMNVFVDGRPVSDREGLSDTVKADSHICVMQALSGG